MPSVMKIFTFSDFDIWFLILPFGIGGGVYYAS